MRLDKKNLHHAYLLEGDREEITIEVLEFVKSLGIKTHGNADVVHIALDSFKIEDARNLKSYALERGLSQEPQARKIFIISVNSFLLEAQNSLLKMFEEPIENTHFFLIVPDASALLKTFVSRFYMIFSKPGLGGDLPGMKDAEKFIAMPLRNRIEFIKELLAKSDEEDEESEVVDLNSTRARALKFLNALESTLHTKVSRAPLDTSYFHQIFKVREFLRMPGSSTKTLMESVALVVPVL